MSPADTLSCVTSSRPFALHHSTHWCPMQTLYLVPQRIDETGRPFPLCHKRVMFSADPLPYTTVVPGFSSRLFTFVHSRDLTSHRLYIMVVHNEGKGNWHSYLSHHCSWTLYSTVVEYVGWSRLVRSSVAVSLRTCRIPSRNRAAPTLATTTVNA